MFLAQKRNRPLCRCKIRVSSYDQAFCMAKGKKQSQTNGSTLDFEAQLWAAADKMRGHMDASEYKHVCLGLIFLKYISDTFKEKRDQLLFGFNDPKSEWFIKDAPERDRAAENRDEYLAANIFWVPPEARWHKIQAKARSPDIGKIIDDAMGAIERENPTLKGVLPRDYARPSLDKVRLGGLVDTKAQLVLIEVLHPPREVLDQFATKTGPLFKRIDSNRSESRTLAALQGALLPKLLSGELRVLTNINGTTL
jgi:type I restriction-modification system DNA methylase subunit